MRDRIYFLDFTALNDWRYRLELTPADVVPLPQPLQYEAIPTDAFLESLSGQSSFDKLPLGLASPMALNLRLRFDKLTDNLKSVIKNYNPASVHDAILQVDIPLLNVWTLRCDFGNTALTDPLSFEIIYRGVQKRGMKQEYVESPDGRVELELQTEHATKYAIECARGRIFEAAVPLAETNANVFDYHYGAVPFVKKATLEQPAKFIDIPTWIENIESIVNDFTLAYLLRLSSNIPFSVTEESNFAIQWFSALTFYAQAGVESTPGTSIQSQLYFLLLAEAQGESGLEAVSGRLPAWTKEYNNALNYLQHFAENNFVKGRWRYFGNNAEYLQTAPVFADFLGSGVHGTITKNDWSGERRLRHSGNTIRAGKAESLDVAHDDDVKEASFEPVGNNNEADYNLSVLLHNLPSYAEINDCVLYYKTTAGMIRVHDVVSITNGIDTFTSAPTGENLPGLEEVFDLEGNPLGAAGGDVDLATLTIQEKSGLPLALCNFCVQNFGKPNSAVLAGTVKMRPDLNIQTLGDLYTIELSPTDAATYGTLGELISIAPDFVQGTAQIEIWMKGA